MRELVPKQAAAIFTRFSIAISLEAGEIKHRLLQIALREFLSCPNG